MNDELNELNSDLTVNFMKTTTISKGFPPAIGPFLGQFWTVVDTLQGASEVSKIGLNKGI